VKLNEQSMLWLQFMHVGNLFALLDKSEYGGWQVSNLGGHFVLQCVEGAGFSGVEVKGEGLEGPSLTNQ